MPFDEDDSELENKPKIGLKFKNPEKQNPVAKKISQEDFDKKVQDIQEKSHSYKRRASELAIQFKKIIEDKTLPQNKNIFANEVEKELLANMIDLAIEINNDPNEQDGMGSLSWITLLFKTALSQRDKLNKLEYSIYNLEKKLEPNNIASLIQKELKDIDKNKKDE